MKLTRNEASTIFMYRARMTKVLNNYKGNKEKIECRWCKEKEENQKHIIEECSEFKQWTIGLKEEEIFEEDVKVLKVKSQQLMEIYEKLNLKKL